MKQMGEQLEVIPGVGPKIATRLRAVGIERASDLAGMNPELLYDKLVKKEGGYLDRCVLYVCRSSVYYASHTHHDPEKLKWWNWKD